MDHYATSSASPVVAHGVSWLVFLSSGKRTRWRQHAFERSEDCTQKGDWSVYEISNIDQRTMKEPSKFQVS